MSLLQDTKPSDYDTNNGNGMNFCLTIGRYEDECNAWAIVTFCQQNGDKWQEVPEEYLHRVIKARYSYCSMPEHWLRKLQRLRKPMTGPAELIRNPQAEGGLQLREANGRIEAASFTFSEAELIQLWPYATNLG